MRYSLRQLEVFLAIAESENVSRAAEAVNLSQSATSSALAELEKQFDIQLFDRIGKRLQLNESGQALRPKAKALLDQAIELEQSFKLHAEAGPVRVGATLTVGNYLAVPLLASYRQRYPEQAVTLDVANTEQIAQRLLNFELDVGLVEGDVRHPDLLAENWQPDELVIVCSPEHPVAGQKTLNDKQLLAADWILRESGSGTRQTFDDAMHDLLPNMNITMELQHMEAIRQAVMQNIGVGCLSRIVVCDDVQRGLLVELKVPQRDLRRSFSFLLHKHKYLGTGLQRWLAFCREA